MRMKKTIIAALIAAASVAAMAQTALPLNTRYSNYGGLLSDLRIDQPTSYAPGSRVFFTLRGEPGARAKILLSTAGGQKSVALSETEQGLYEGFYTVKPYDNFNRVEFSAKVEKHGRVSEAWASSQHFDYPSYETRMEPRFDPPVRDVRETRRELSCLSCGTIVEIREVDERSAEANVPGIVVGGLVGGIIGNQFGQGGGKDAATLLGLLAGGAAGNEIAKNQARSKAWLITVRYDNGTTQQFKNGERPNASVGQRVKVQDNQLYPMERY